MKRYREWHVNKHSVFYSQGFRKNQLRNNFGVFLTFFKVVLVLFVQKWKVKNIAFKMTLVQYDVPSAFLQSPIDIPVFLRQPIGFKTKGKENWIWRLKKCVYGLKQASLQCRTEFDNFVTNVLKYSEVGYNSCVYILRNGTEITSILMVYVDDFILAATNEELHQKIEKELINKFRVKTIGTLKILNLIFLIPPMTPEINIVFPINGLP
jgi:hypothetical protein